MTENPKIIKRYPSVDGRSMIFEYEGKKIEINGYEFNHSISYHLEVLQTVRKIVKGK